MILITGLEQKIKKEKRISDTMDEVIESLVIWFNDRDLSLHLDNDDEISIFYHLPSYCSETESTRRISIQDLFLMLTSGKNIEDIKKSVLKKLGKAQQTIKEQKETIAKLEDENNTLKETIKIMK